LKKAIFLLAVAVLLITYISITTTTGVDNKIVVDKISATNIKASQLSALNTNKLDIEIKHISSKQGTYNLVFTNPPKITTDIFSAPKKSQEPIITKVLPEPGKTITDSGIVDTELQAGTPGSYDILKESILPDPNKFDQCSSIVGDVDKSLCTGTGGSCSCFGCCTTECCTGICDLFVCTDGGCNGNYPHLCSGQCWSTCDNPSFPNFNCNSGSPVCCPAGYPYYCSKTDSCWAQSDICGRLELCGGSWNYCSDPTDVPNCVGENFYCCPSTHPYYCSLDGFCHTSSSSCCTDECSWGATRCVGNSEQTCGDYDTDTCSEWGGDISCQFGCAGGACIQQFNAHGFLVDEDTNPLSGITVKMTDCSDIDRYSDITDITGHFDMSGTSGDYKFKILMPYGTLTLEDPVTGNQCFYYSGDVDFGNLPVPTKFTLNGIVQNEFGNPLVGAIAKLATCGDTVIVTDTINPSDGSFSLTTTYGSYKLKIEYNGKDYEFILGDNLCNYYATGNYDISAPLVIPEDAHILGNVTDEFGNLQQGMVIKLLTCSGSLVDSDLTDISGEYELIGDPGFYKIMVGTSFGDLTLYLNGKDCNYFDNLYYTIDIELPLHTQIHGYFYDLNNNPINNLPIELYDCSDNFVNSNNTDSSGYFYISDASGFYQLMVVIEGIRFKLVDQNDNSCFLFLGDVDIGTININPTIDCSVF